MMQKKFCLLLILLSFLFSCKEPSDPNPTIKVNFLRSPSLVLNPSTYAPLSAQISLETETPVSLKLRVFGRHGEASDVLQEFDDLETNWEIPVLGLYPDFENTVELQFFNATQEDLGTQTFQVQTAPLISDMPQISIQVEAQSGIKPGFNLVNYFGNSGDFLPQRPFMFDSYGDIRWYLNYRSHPIFSTLFFDNGLNLLENGNFIFGDGNSSSLYEINRLGEILNTWSLAPYGFHHHVIEKPNGNLLVTVNNNSIPTVEDFIIEIDRATGAIVNTWDLNQSLDNQRRSWETDLADLNIDWFHGNGLAYDANEDAILVSGRTQGLVKLSASNEVIWILAPHKAWATAGNGQDLNQYLLQPLDANGQNINNTQVLEGDENHPDFEWAWYQHSPIILPNGRVMLFDNGENRNFSGLGSYSRAVEYEIDPMEMTIQQTWDYGKERSGQTYSRIVSKVSYHENENTVLFTPGATVFNGVEFGKVIEIDRASGNVLFEATVRPPTAPFNITFHNVQRLPLY